MVSASPRYAKALLSVAGTAQEAEKIEEIISDFSEIMETSHELRFFMLNPVIPAAAKKGVIKELLPDVPPVFAENFLYLLVDNNRLSDLPQIVEAYSRELTVKNGILMVRVTSAKELDPKEIDEISKSYGKKYNSEKVRVTVCVDERLLGGLKVQIGDMLTDNSLYSRLRGLEAAIL